MSESHQLVADPWNDLPEGASLYEDLVLAEVGPETALTEVRERYFELMEAGWITKEAEHAYNVIQVLGRRLAMDVNMFDAQTAGELLQCLRDMPNNSPAAKPLNEQLRFAWPV